MVFCQEWYEKEIDLESFIEGNIVYFSEVGCSSQYAIGAQAVQRWSTTFAARGVGAAEKRPPETIEF